MPRNAFNKKHLVRAVPGLVILALFAWAGRRYLADLPGAVAAAPGRLVLVALLFVAMKACMAEVFRAALFRLDCQVGYLRCFALVMAMTFANQFIPKSGLGVPALYLKVVYGLELAKFSALILPVTVIQFAAGAFIGVFCSAAAFTGRPFAEAAPFLVLFSSVFIGAGLLLLCPPPRLPEALRTRLPGFMVRFGDGWETLRTSRRLLLRILAVQIAVLLLRAVRLQAAYAAVGGAVSFTGATAVSILAQYALLIGLTPGSLGFREAAITWTRTLVGVDQETAALAALFDRTGMVLAALCVGGPLLVALAHSLRLRRESASGDGRV